MIKYMGSKRSLLRNGLGDVIGEESREGNRVVDLFCGSASVSWFAAVELGQTVLACDLQEFAVVLAGAVLGRTRPIDHSVLEMIGSSTRRRADEGTLRGTMRRDSNGGARRTRGGIDKPRSCVRRGTGTRNC